jgi:hypothetical protein
MVLEEPTKRYRFAPYGPFELPLEGDSTIARKRLGAFWKEIEARHPGLNGAIGCYVFGIRVRAKTLPWYVGKTEKKSFKLEAVQPHKLLYYQEALKAQPGGTALLYLLPRLTDAGNFRTAWKGGSSSVDRLERMLIATALERNPQLLNEKSKRHLTQTIVPGYMNEPRGRRSPEAEHLAVLLGTARV